MSYTELLYFIMLRALYQYAKATDMDAERGRREKAKITEAVRKYQSDMELVRHAAELQRDTGEARAEYRKARKEAQITPYLPADLVSVIAAADKIVETLDGIPVEGGDANLPLDK